MFNRLALAACAALFSISAHAAETANWGVVKGWTIGVDFTVGSGCFISTDFEDGTTFRMGFDKADGGAYMVVGNKKWTSLEDGKDYEISVQMDRGKPWYATASGGHLDDLPILIAKTTEANFIIEFMRKKGIRVNYDKAEIANLSLWGTSAAVQEMVRCQDEIDKNGGKGGTANGDPFAGSAAQPAKTDDPFAN